MGLRDLEFETVVSNINPKEYSLHDRQNLYELLGANRSLQFNLFRCIQGPYVLCRV